MKKEDALTIRNKIFDAVNQVLLEHQYKIDDFNIEYSKQFEKFSCKISCTSTSQEYQKAHAKLLGFPEEVLGQKIMMEGQEFEIVGFDPKKKKFSVLGRRTKDDKIFGIPAYIARRKLAPFIENIKLMKFLHKKMGTSPGVKLESVVQKNKPLDAKTPKTKISPKKQNQNMKSQKINSSAQTVSNPSTHPIVVKKSLL